MKRQIYQEGSVVAIPLVEGGYATGLIGRRAPRGGGILTLFCFGPRRKTKPKIEDCADLHPTNATLVLRSGDYGIKKGTWKVVGSLPQWNRDDWRTPDLIRKDDATRTAWRVSYDDSNPNKVVGEVPMAYDALLETTDGLWGYLLVEQVLSEKM
jgi:hypothetical protein